MHEGGQINMDTPNVQTITGNLVALVSFTRAIQREKMKMTYLRADRPSTQARSPGACGMRSTDPLLHTLNPVCSRARVYTSLLTLRS